MATRSPDNDNHGDNLDATLMSAEEIAWRTKIIRLTRMWIGTPYHHQASLRGVGTDCFGLVRGVWRELYEQDRDPEDVPPYSWDWAEAKDEETMLEAAKRHMQEIEIGTARAGDVLIFRYRETYNSKHAGIMIGGRKMIHASLGQPTCEVYLNSWWDRHTSGAFAFPLPGKVQ